MTRTALRRSKQIVFYCEGPTEEIAVKKFIRPQWEKDGLKPVGLRTINLRGKLGDVRVKVPLELLNPKVVAVFTIIDLYGMTSIGKGRSHSLAGRVEAAREWLRDEFDEEVLRRFHPHLSVHELEAWILADPDSLKKKFGPGARVQEIDCPEEKDNRNPPKQRLKQIFRQNGRDTYRETRDAPDLFGRLDFDTVYGCCPYFKEFYDELKEVGIHARDEL